MSILKYSKINNLSGYVVAIEPHKENAKNKGAYLVLNIGKRLYEKKYIKVKIIGTTENQLERRFGYKNVIVSQINVYETDFGVFYTTSNIRNVKKPTANLFNNLYKKVVIYYCYFF